MDSLTVEEVTEMLQAASFPEDLVASLASNSLVRNILPATSIILNRRVTENHIDGATLIALPDDLRVSAPYSSEWF
jgi:hypothetical protein